MRSVLVSVTDLARSVSFYRDVLGLRERAREGEVTVLESESGSFAILLREVTGQPLHHGRQELGLRAVNFDVGSRTELEAVADRLEAAGALVSRSVLDESESFEIVTGRDPDRLPLIFITYESDHPLHDDHYRHVALHMYSVDV